MGLLSNVKPLLPLLLTFVLPRAITYYRTLKTSLRTRPLPKPLPSDVWRGLNVLFLSICYFLYASLPSWHTSEENVFISTNSRLMIPTEVLFGGRLALIRPRGQLTPFDEALRAKLTTSASRQLYLRFGPATLVNCAFCHPDDEISYLLFHLPTNLILPHLLHLLFLGAATSEPLAGFEARQWRRLFATCSLAIAAMDLYLTTTYWPHVDPNMPAPAGFYWQARSLRPLIICLFDVVASSLLYVGATNRLLLFSPLAAHDPQVTKRQREQLLGQTNIALQMAQTKLRAYSMTRNAIVRQPSLKTTDDEYWRAVVAMEGPTGVDGVWNDEDVQAAVSRSLGSGGIDFTRLERDADSFVANVIRGLE